jgi:hypothetical protein
MATRAFRLSGLGLGGLFARDLPGAVSGVAARFPDLFVRPAPVAHLLVGERPIPLNNGPKFNRRHHRLGIRRHRAALALGVRRPGGNRQHC